MAAMGGEALAPADLLAILLGLAAAIGCINHLWIKLPPAIGMLLGSLALAAVIVGSDHIFHLHIMHWFRSTFAAANLLRFFLDGALAGGQGFCTCAGAAAASASRCPKESQWQELSSANVEHGQHWEQAEQSPKPAGSDGARRAAGVALVYKKSKRRGGSHGENSAMFSLCGRSVAGCHNNPACRKAVSSVAVQ
jgi:hypothetical protein